MKDVSIIHIDVNISRPCNDEYLAHLASELIPLQQRNAYDPMVYARAYQDGYFGDDRPGFVNARINVPSEDEDAIVAMIDAIKKAKHMVNYGYGVAEALLDVDIHGEFRFTTMFKATLQCEGSGQRTITCRTQDRALAYNIRLIRDNVYAVEPTDGSHAVTYSSSLRNAKAWAYAECIDWAARVNEAWD